MSFPKTAQSQSQFLEVFEQEPKPTVVVVDPSSIFSSSFEGGEGEVLEVTEPLEHDDPHILEVHESEGHDEESDQLEVIDPANIELVIGELPGAPDGTEDPIPEAEPELVVEEPEEVLDENEAKTQKKNEKWDWASKGAEGFVPWIKDRFDSIPKHSGKDSAGLERAISYLDRLDSEISKAMRLDLDGDLDANKVEEVRVKIDDGISRLQDRLDKMKKFKKTKRKKTASFVKEGQKIAGVQGIVVTVPLLISRIARVCINGTISAGHSIEDMFKRQAEKYKLTTRERAETIQLIQDMGFPMRMDRGYLDDEEVDQTSSDNFDWAANYQS